MDTQVSTALDEARWTQRVEMLAVLAVMALALGLRLALLDGRSIWVDEYYSLTVAGKSWSEMWQYLRFNDAHPIGYYALLAEWIRWAGTGLAQMRASSLLLGLGSVYLTWRVGRELFAPAIGLLAAAYVAVHPFQIIASNEIRMYPLLGCLVLASAWVLWRATRPAAPMGWWLGYGALAAASAYTSYYTFLFLPGPALWILLSRPAGRVLKGLGLAGAVALALYVPWVPHVIALLGRVFLPWRQPVGTLDYASALLATQTFGGYLFDIGTYHNDGHFEPAYLLLLLPFCGLMVAGAIALGRINRPARGLLGLSWIVPMVLIIILRLVSGREPVFTRHLVVLEPFAALLMAGGIVQLGALMAAASRPSRAPSRRTALAGLAFLASLAVCYPAVLNAQTNPAYQFYRFDLLAASVQASYRKGDAVLFFPETALAFRYYFNPPGPQLVIRTNTQEWSRAAYRTPGQHVAQFLATHRVHRAWLIFAPPFPNGSVDELRAALGAVGYVHSPVQDFRLLWAALFINPQFGR